MAPSLVVAPRQVRSLLTRACMAANDELPAGEGNAHKIDCAGTALLGEKALTRVHTAKNRNENRCPWKVRAG